MTNQTIKKELSLETQSAIASELNIQESSAESDHLEVLDRSGAKLSDLESELDYMREYQSKARTQSHLAAENIMKLTELKSKYDAIDDDCEKVIQANLAAINELRTRGISSGRK